MAKVIPGTVDDGIEAAIAEIAAMLRRGKARNMVIMGPAAPTEDGQILQFPISIGEPFRRTVKAGVIGLAGRWHTDAEIQFMQDRIALGVCERCPVIKIDIHAFDEMEIFLLVCSVLWPHGPHADLLKQRGSAADGLAPVGGAGRN